jgi:rod shape-determining protein MreB
MVVDIGGGTTEIAVISLGGIVINHSIRVAGDGFTNEIQQYMRQQHSIKIGELTAEDIKIKVGAALSELDEYPEPYVVRGPNLMTAHPVEVNVTSQEIAHCLDKSLAKIEAAVISVLEQTPPELYADIVQRGIFLTGGGALLRGLDKRLYEKINIEFHVSEDPLHAVARGTSVALKNTDRYPFLMR